MKMLSPCALLRLTRIVCLGLALGTGASLQAQIAQVPLLTRSVAIEPNLVFMFDDSGSMDANYLYQYGGSAGGMGMSGPSGTSGNSNSNASAQYAPDVNILYYDPRYTYLPRVNANGTRQAAASTSGLNSFPLFWRSCEPTSSAPNNSCTGANANYGNTVALLSGAYLPAPSVLASNADPTVSYPNTASSATAKYPKFKDRTDCTGGSGSAQWCTWANELQNYANWSTFYSTRIEMAKSSIGEAIYQTFSPTSTPNLRIGWSTINNLSGNSTLDKGVGLFDSTVRSDFYTWLYALTTNGSTPTRNSLDKVGRYFSRSDNSGPWADAPVRTSTGISSSGTAVSTHASCRRSFAMLVTDGYWNDSSAPSGIGNVDNTAATIPNPNGANFSYTPAAPYKDSQSGTLADVAMKYWITDLRPDLPNRVPPIPGVNESFWQNMSLYGVTLGVTGSLSQDAATKASLSNGSLAWPTAQANSPTGIDDLWHATINTRGDLLTAESTASLTRILSGMFGTINRQTATQSGVAVSTANLTNGTRKYTPQYTTVTWTGNVTARNLDPKTGSEISTAWQVERGTDATTGDPLSTVPAPSSRNIVVWNSTGAAPVAFDYTAMSAAGISADLGTSASAQLVNYLRGDSSNEIRKGGTYRNRSAVLGDIVNSSPVFIKGNIDLNYDRLPTAEASTYRAFVGTKQARTEGVLIVGANDGMLHAFRDSNGAEIFAFVPRAVLPGLSKLADPNYAHQYFVDGPNIETDAYLGGSWRNLVIGTTGAGIGASTAPYSGGAKAVYAIDVTSPLTISASNVLWEVNPASPGLGELGHVLWDVQAGQMPNGQWVAIFGNGYYSASGTARLFVVNLTNGNLIREIDTQVGGITAKNGLGGVRLVRNSRQQIIGAYAGDLYGNLWKFDLSDLSASAWRIGNNGAPVFQVNSSTLSAPSSQAITATPAVLAHPSGTGFVVSLGTGKFFENADVSSTATQSMYGIWDKTGFGAPTTGSAVIGTSALVQQTISNPIAVTRTAVDGSTYIVNYYSISQNKVDWTTKSGWFINLPNTGQRVAYPVEVIASPFISVDTISPAGTTTADICTSATGGSGWLYLINGLTGAGPSESVLDTNGDGNITSADLILSGFNTRADGRNTNLKVDSLSDATQQSFVILSGGESSATQVKFSCAALGNCPPSVTSAIKSRKWRQLFMR